MLSYFPPPKSWRRRAAPVEVLFRFFFALSRTSRPWPFQEPRYICRVIHPSQSVCQWQLSVAVEPGALLHCLLHCGKEIRGCKWICNRCICLLLADRQGKTCRDNFTAFS